MVSHEFSPRDDLSDLTPEKLFTELTHGDMIYSMATELSEGQLLDIIASLEESDKKLGDMVATIQEERRKAQIQLANAREALMLARDRNPGI